MKISNKIINNKDNEDGFPSKIKRGNEFEKENKTVNILSRIPADDGNISASKNTKPIMYLIKGNKINSIKLNLN